MTASDNPKSPIGAALFDMMSDMLRAQARVYCAGGDRSSAIRAARIAAAPHKPIIMMTIRRNHSQQEV